jgi:hypothetical protein
MRRITVIAMLVLSLVSGLAGTTTTAAEGTSNYAKVYPIKYHMSENKLKNPWFRFEIGYEQDGEWLLSPMHKINFAKDAYERNSVYAAKGIVARNTFIFDGYPDSDRKYGIYRWDLVTDKLELLSETGVRAEELFDSDGRTVVMADDENHRIEALDLSTRKTKSFEAKGYILRAVVDSGIVVYLYRDKVNLEILMSYNLQTGEERELAFIPYSKRNDVVKFMDFKNQTIVWTHYNADDTQTIHRLDLRHDADGIPDQIATEADIVNLELNEDWISWDNGEGWKFSDISQQTPFNFQPEVPKGERIVWVKGQTLLTQKAVKASLPENKIYALGNPNPWVKKVQIVIDGQKKNFDKEVIQKNGSVFVPFRVIFEALGYSVKWNSKTMEVIGERQGKIIRLKVDSKTASANGRKVTLQAAPMMQTSTLYVPLRFIGESSGKNVNWEAESQTVSLSSKRTIGKLVSGDGRYEGELLDGQMDGKGRLYDENGELWYEANFVKGSIEGFGTIYYPDGSRFVGMFTEGIPTGYGKYILPTGVVWYRGEFKFGRKDGYGIEYDSDLGFIRYVGYWKNNLKHGKGINKFGEQEEYDMGKKVG